MVPFGSVGLVPAGWAPVEAGDVGLVVPVVVVAVVHEVVAVEAVVLAVSVAGGGFADSSFPYGKSLVSGLEGVSVEC